MENGAVLQLIFACAGDWLPVTTARLETPGRATKAATTTTNSNWLNLAPVCLVDVREMRRWCLESQR